MSQLEELEIPEAFDYKKILSLGNEAREKLNKIKPTTLGQASRISGINPSFPASQRRRRWYDIVIRRNLVLLQ